MSERARVFGVGLSRTGTSTLASALSLLGWRPIHFPQDDRTFHQLLTADFRLDILSTYDAVLDTPAAAFFPQLDAAFPGSRFILTTRERATWHESCRRFWAATSAAQERQYETFINTAVYGVPTYDHQRFDYVYDRHVREVMHHFVDRSDDLLVIDICGGEGWERLCPFLGVATRRDAFPHEYAAGAVGDERLLWSKTYKSRAGRSDPGPDG